MQTQKKLAAEDAVSNITTLSHINKPLLRWYQENKRDLPWRGGVSAYHTWISEIMLQQTRVEAVIPYYQRFLSALPDIKHLAQVEEQVLLKLWEGLGYYNRARNLKKTARIMVTGGKNDLPPTYDELLMLPGIGPYTAGAIASIAYGQAVPAVDGNVYRVITRLLEIDHDITDSYFIHAFASGMKNIIPDANPGDFNQALMELGATVCIPNGKPLCETCPLNEDCLASEHNSFYDFPNKPPKKARKIVPKTLFILRTDSLVYLQKRDQKGVLLGLWELPSVDGSLSPTEARDYLTAAGIKFGEIAPLPDAKHIFTHLEWHMIAYTVSMKKTQVLAAEKESAWVGEYDLKSNYPLPSAFGAYKKYLFR